jgi:hypothetical protein
MKGAVKASIAQRAWPSLHNERISHLRRLQLGPLGFEGVLLRLQLGVVGLGGSGGLRQGLLGLICTYMCEQPQGREFFSCLSRASSDAMQHALKVPSVRPISQVSAAVNAEHTCSWLAVLDASAVAARASASCRVRVDGLGGGGL